MRYAFLFLILSTAYPLLAQYKKSETESLYKLMGAEFKLLRKVKAKYSKQGKIKSQYQWQPGNWITKHFTKYSYDALGRKTTEVVKSISNRNRTQSIINWTYEPGKEIKTHKNFTTIIDHDSLGRKIKEVDHNQKKSAINY